MVFMKIEWARKVRASWVNKNRVHTTEGDVMESVSIISELEKLVINYARKALEFPAFYQGQTC